MEWPKSGELTPVFKIPDRMNDSIGRSGHEALQSYAKILSENSLWLSLIMHLNIHKDDIQCVGSSSSFWLRVHAEFNQNNSDDKIHVIFLCHLDCSLVHFSKFIQNLLWWTKQYFQVLITRSTLEEFTVWSEIEFSKKKDTFFDWALINMWFNWDAWKPSKSVHVQSCSKCSRRSPSRRILSLDGRVISGMKANASLRFPVFLHSLCAVNMKVK